MFKKDIEIKYISISLSIQSPLHLLNKAESLKEKDKVQREKKAELAVV